VAAAAAAAAAVAVAVPVVVVLVVKINWDMYTEFSCKNQFRNGFLEVSEYGMSSVKPLSFCMLTVFNCVYLLIFNLLII
jgi:hypothetical protein